MIQNRNTILEVYLGMLMDKRMTQKKHNFDMHMGNAYEEKNENCEPVLESNPAKVNSR